MADIIDSLNKKELNQFEKDFKEFLRVAVGMSKAYKKATGKLKAYMPRYKNLIELFNKKYAGIKFRLLKKTDELDLIILLNEKSVKDLFTNAASKIAGLKFVGLNGFDEVSLEDTQKFSATTSAIQNQLYLSYYYPGKGADTIYLKFDSKEKMVGLTFDFDLIKDEKSPEFKLCAYYALKGGFDSNIDLYNEAASFGFVDVLTEAERRKYLDKFDPRMWE